MALKLTLVLLMIALALLFTFVDGVKVETKSVSYDGRSLKINGRRELLFSGSIHYPRSPPQMWQDILQKAKRGGLNVIQTYVFWNVHESVQNQFNFKGNYDLVKFIKMIGEHGMYVTLRIGPFIEAEWNYGGFPFWLREVPNITFRSDNPQFKFHMKRFTKIIVDMMKDAKLYASQGGPIILSQIENEYSNIQHAYRESGTRYVEWAGKMASGFKTGVPWVMCEQMDAPDPVINTCNGRNCGDTFTGPNRPYKPALWTENWTAHYRVFGDPINQRTAEDIAFSVARFFSKNGTLVNYYMYYGGTNFGRTASSFVTTQYYDEAPIDEYGLLREPKWSHLRDLHAALRLSKKALFAGTPSVETFSESIEVMIYEKKGTNICAAFLCNKDEKVSTTITFRGSQYDLPPHSISILPDCKTVVFNTQMVVAQQSLRNYLKSRVVDENIGWKMYQESIPSLQNALVNSERPLELMSTTKDSTDYLWYTTSVELDGSDLPTAQADISATLEVSNFGHIMHAFVNGAYIGSAHGRKEEKSFLFQKAITLKRGTNLLSVLGATVGYPDGGAYLEHRIAGVRVVTIKGLNSGTLDLTGNGWGHKVGLNGEKLQIFTSGASRRVQWSQAKGQTGPFVPTWYKAYFDAPNGNDPIAIDLETMSKGMAWINGKSIGRYWVSFLSPSGKPSQSIYHIPRAFLKPKDNLLVLLEEMGGNPHGIQILTANRDTICSFITEIHPPHVKAWKRENGTVIRNKRENGTVIRNKVWNINPRPSAYLTCPDKKEIVSIEFASYGNPLGECGSYSEGNCTIPNSHSVIEKLCLGKTRCVVPMKHKIFSKDNDICSQVSKALAIQVQCGSKN